MKWLHYIFWWMRPKLTEEILEKYVNEIIDQYHGSKKCDKNFIYRKYGLTGFTSRRKTSSNGYKINTVLHIYFTTIEYNVNKDEMLYYEIKIKNKIFKDATCVWLEYCPNFDFSKSEYIRTVPKDCVFEMKE